MRRTESPQVELQIAPLIDVCFLLLFFYILTSKPVKPEKDLAVTLPGTAQQETPLEIPDELRIEILDSGQIIMNQEPLDTPNSSDLPQLHAVLGRFALSAIANKTNAMVTLDPSDATRHQRLIDVLNVCAELGIQSVSFADARDARN